MTTTEFERLSINEQAEYVWSHQLLDIRMDLQHRILLYSLPDFYVEVDYHAKENRIVRIKAFRDIRKLSPYLKK